MQQMIRCPSCRAENSLDALQCEVCDRRLFAWMGDLFGARDSPDERSEPDAARTAYWRESLQEASAGTPSTIVAPRDGFPGGKAVVAATFVWITVWFAPLGAVLIAVAAGFVLLRWRRVEWPMFLAVLIGLLVVEPMARFIWGVR